MLFALVLVSTQCNSEPDVRVLKIGMTANQVYTLLRKSKPDSVTQDASFYNGVQMLSVSGKCVVEFDSLKKLNYFSFETAWEYKDALRNSAILVFGNPRDTVKLEGAKHFFILSWHVDNTVYHYSEVGNRCTFSGGTRAELREHVISLEAQEAPEIKRSLTLWIGMSRSEVYKWLKITSPDSLGKDGFEIFFRSQFLGVEDTCAVKFDRSNKLTDFYFVAPVSAWTTLVKGTLSAFGKPSRQGPLPGSHEHFEGYFWNFKDQNYNLFQNDFGVMLTGNKPVSHPAILEPDIPPPPR